MNTRPELLTSEFRALSARLGQDSLQVQGPGGNTSIKDADVMWIKASGTELAQAEDENIFVAVERNAAVKEAHGDQGDGSCKTTIIDPSLNLRPSIETTFHAVLDHAVVAHTHSVATLVHAISPEGGEACRDKLAHLSPVLVPYAKPGLPLTREIMARISPDTKVIILQNHGLICCGGSVEEVSELIEEVEELLAMPPCSTPQLIHNEKAPVGFEWVEEGWMALDERVRAHVTAGSYYPDHVVFLGPVLPTSDQGDAAPAILIDGKSIAIRSGATPAQWAMLRCLSDIFSRLPETWNVEPIGLSAEAELLNWDAEKYRQALAERS